MNTAAECAALTAEVARLKAVNAHLTAAIRSPSKSRKLLHDFLNAAAGEGLVLGNVDSADLYVLIFPAEYAAQVEGLTCKLANNPS